jgi:hypothetical protein
MTDRAVTTPLAETASLDPRSRTGGARRLAVAAAVLAAAAALALWASEGAGIFAAQALAALMTCL